MTDAEIIKIVKQAVKQELAPLIMMSVVSNKDQFRSSTRRFALDSVQSNLRNVQPFGFASRPTPGMDCLVAPINHDPSHLAMIGQFDASRPVVNDGEAALYDANGNLIYFKSSGDVMRNVARDEVVDVGRDSTETVGRDKTVEATRNIVLEATLNMKLHANLLVELLKSGAASPFVLGDVLQVALDALANDLSTLNTALTTFASACATSTTDPILAAAAAALATPLGAFAAAITLFQSVYVDSPATNILSQKIFGDRA